MTAYRTWPVWVLAFPAGVAIWGGWVELGALCGFGPVRPLPGIVDGLVVDLAVTLPIGVEALGALAVARVVDPTTPAPVRTFARWCAATALTLGAGGQVGYHLLAAAGADRAPWPVIAIVAVLPVVTLALGATLAHLMHAHAPTAPTTPVVPDVLENPCETPQMEGNTDGSLRPRGGVLEFAVVEEGTGGVAGAGGRSASPGNPGGIDVSHTPVGSACVDPKTLPAQTDIDEVTPAVPAPKPAPVTSPDPVTGSDPDPTNPAPASASAAVPCEVMRLAAKYPSWTQQRIADTAGVSVRTVRRRIAAAKAAAVQASPEGVAA